MAQRLCAGTGKGALERRGSVLPHCPDCGRAMRNRRTRDGSNPWYSIPRHFVEVKPKEND